MRRQKTIRSGTRCRLLGGSQLKDIWDRHNPVGDLTQTFLYPQKAAETKSFRTGIIPSLGINPERWQSFRGRQLHMYLVPFTIVCGIRWTISEDILVS
jgi:hypothetical protein